MKHHLDILMTYVLLNKTGRGSFSTAAAAAAIITNFLIYVRPPFLLTYLKDRLIIMCIVTFSLSMLKYCYFLNRRVIPKNFRISFHL